MQGLIMLDKEKYVLVLIDIQKESRFGVENILTVVNISRKLIDTCRSLGIPLIYTRQINRQDGVGLSRGEELDNSGNPVFYCTNTDAIEIIDDIAPDEKDIVVDKYRWSAFYKTSLELFLQSIGAKNLIIGGLVTDGCLMTSVIDGYYRDFQIHLVKDMCATTCEGGHMASIMIMANWVYGIRIYNAEQMVRCLKGQDYSVWESTKAVPFHFTPENMRREYSRLDTEAIRIQDNQVPRGL